MNQTVKERIELLEDFDAALARWFHGSAGENEQELRRSLNEMASVARTIVAECGTGKLITIAPPAMVGGAILRNLDPFDMIFDSPYGASLIPTLRDAIQQALGVLRSGRFEEVKSRTKKARPVSTQLPAPEKVTLKWLFHNVPYTFWMMAAGALFAVFAFGVKAASWSFVQEILGNYPH